MIFRPMENNRAKVRSARETTRNSQSKRQTRADHSVLWALEFYINGHGNSNIISLNDLHFFCQIVLVFQIRIECNMNKTLLAVDLFKK